MKRRLLITAVAVLALSLAAYGTLAFLTGSATAHNVITAGSVEIELLDQTVSAVKPTSFPAEGLKVMPGTTVSKEVSVRNHSSECWVRVKVVEEIKLETQNEFLPAGDYVIPDLNVGTEPDQWTDAGGGYYYYNSPLAVGAETSKLFSKVTFDKGMGNEFQNASLEIQVYAEAVQTANNGIPADGKVTSVQGWPETPADR